MPDSQIQMPTILRSEPNVLLEASNLTRDFAPRDYGGRAVRAVNDVSFIIGEGEALGLVGESGSGKSTTGRLVLRLLEPTSGSVLFAGRNIAGMTRPELFDFRRQAQIVFQDPFSSLNPRMKVGQIVAEPMLIHRVSQGHLRDEVARLLERVGLQGEHAERYPFQFSGGQRQRISIARALSLNPRLIVADEPVSSLDVSVQAQIINLLRDLQDERGLSLLFISHNLAVVRHLCSRTAVMQRGIIVEQGPTQEIFERPRHPYTKALLDSILM